MSEVNVVAALAAGKGHLDRPEERLDRTHQWLHLMHVRRRYRPTGHHNDGETVEATVRQLNPRATVPRTVRCHRSGRGAQHAALHPVAAAQTEGWAEVPAGQEIVFISVRLDGDRVRALLGAALLTDAELDAGPNSWAGYSDPFPAWGMYDRA